MRNFVTCFDFVLAGLHKHDECCKRCHDTVSSHIKPKVPEQYKNLQYYCCCSFAGREFTAEQMELVLQQMKGEDD
jgi:hypothetical protein